MGESLCLDEGREDSAGISETPLTEASFAGLYAGSCLSGRRWGLPAAAGAGEKDPGSHGGPAAPGGGASGDVSSNSLGRAVPQNQGEVIWPKPGGKPSVGSVGAQGASCLGIPASQWGESLASSP